MSFNVPVAEFLTMDGNNENTTDISPRAASISKYQRFPFSFVADCAQMALLPLVYTVFVNSHPRRRGRGVAGSVPNGWNLEGMHER
ncbi:hypothetical protein HNY73_005760 [Argiope bruennichi]|uniref:Uncharacterized protein n=1 Tax=Argiope bruennichi TaxID=94029 RepID=A0A8T0FHQ1_ARGBR|nr:hypothetical protein HNY73_005760 [Argiope bruennichi]